MTEDSDSDRGEQEGSEQRWPIGFILLVAAVALYLGWRLVQGVGALIGWAAG